jgi:hypothetical protein
MSLWTDLLLSLSWPLPQPLAFISLHRAVLEFCWSYEVVKVICAFNFSLFILLKRLSYERHRTFELRRLARLASALSLVVEVS